MNELCFCQHQKDQHDLGWDGRCTGELAPGVPCGCKEFLALHAPEVNRG